MVDEDGRHALMEGSEGDLFLEPRGPERDQFRTGPRTRWTRPELLLVLACGEDRTTSVRRTLHLAGFERTAKAVSDSRWGMRGSTVTAERRASLASILGVATTALPIAPGGALEADLLRDVEVPRSRNGRTRARKHLASTGTRWTRTELLTLLSALRSDPDDAFNSARTGLNALERAGFGGRSVSAVDTVIWLLTSRAGARSERAPNHAVTLGLPETALPLDPSGPVVGGLLAGFVVPRGIPDPPTVPSDPPRVRRLATTPLREVLRTLAALATLPGFESAEVRLGSEVVDVGADGSVRVRPE